MGEKLNKSDYQNHEFMCRSKKREQYLKLVRQIESMDPKKRNYNHLTYKDFLIQKINRIEKLMRTEPLLW